ncbi:MAG TPA: metalloregulator ArsR/SmtB family transcription factor [Candidatus Limnocylindrales bacterium]|nr:metalloregulator ArsR/SmtB family transcription factor [Candidatus Limnocylindrales bacterium]
MALRELTVVRQRGECCALPAVDSDWAEQTAILMKALADPTRLTMVAALWKAKAPICICDFTADLELTQPTISHHMAKLKEAGLVEAEKDGIWMYYRLRHDIAPQTRRLLSDLIPRDR